MQQRVVARTVQGVQTVLSPARDFIRTESSSGIVLILAALLAFAWANSPWASSYFGILDTTAGVQFGDFVLEKPLLLWVNDLLMALFFFLVGLEIKRELIVGELKSRRKAVLPIAGALGGMVVPALIFIGLNLGQPALRGWGIPMATDIAFALGVLALLGNRVDLSLKIFLLALAIVDDLGAVFVIAAFYTDNLDVASLGLATMAWVIALGYGRLGAARPVVFAVIGIVMWYFMLKSGIHSTVAGVLMALAIPLRHRLSADELEAELRPLMVAEGGFEEVEVAIERLEDVVDRAHSPLHNMEHALAPIVAFLIMPIFAFFNAGVAIAGGETALVASRVDRRRPRTPRGQADRDHRLRVAGRAVRAHRPAGGRQVERDDRSRPARRHRLHDVAVHRQPCLRTVRGTRCGEGRRARGIRDRRADRARVPLTDVAA